MFSLNARKMFECHAAWNFKNRTMNALGTGGYPAIGDFNKDGRPDIGVPVNCPGVAGVLGQVCLAALINRS